MAGGAPKILGNLAAPLDITTTIGTRYPHSCSGGFPKGIGASRRMTECECEQSIHIWLAEGKFYLSSGKRPLKAKAARTPPRVWGRKCIRVLAQFNLLMCPGLGGREGSVGLMEWVDPEWLDLLIGKPMSGPLAESDEKQHQGNLDEDANHGGEGGPGR